MTDIHKNIQDAKNWFLSSRAQNLDNKDRYLHGSFSSWLNLDTNQYEYVYTEITGYGITSLLFLHELFGDEILIDRARYAADWIRRIAIEICGGVRTRYYLDEKSNIDHYSFDTETTYTFDDGIVLFALTKLYMRTQDKKYLQLAEFIGNFLVGILQKQDGSFFASYDPINKHFEDSPKKWSTQSGSYHAKVAMGILSLYEVTREEKYKKSVMTFCEYALKQQTREGRFVTFRDTKGTHMHPHCYSAEGLFYTGTVLNEQRYIDAALRAAKWAISTQLEDGGVPCTYIHDVPNKNQRSDTLAQVLRLGVLAAQHGTLNDEEIAQIKKLKDKLAQYQLNDGPQKGGFLFGNDFDGKKLHHVNSWCTMFALQGLLMYDLFFNKKKKIDFGLIV
ncbi:MAG: hypothetical protein V1725_05850 [archaeon]